MIRPRSIFSCIILMLCSCGTDFKKPYSDTPTSGIVNIGADETLSPLANTCRDTFMGLYRYATINMKLESESQAFKDLLNDSVKVIMASRKLNDTELGYFKSRNLIPVTTKVAQDAIALIINKSNPDSLISIQRFKDVLSGKISNWKELNKTSAMGNINVVFDNNGSSIVRYLHDSLLQNKSFPSNCFAVNSNPEVIDYVEKHPNSIGIIGVNWISDKDDPKMLSFNKRIRVMWISKRENGIFPDEYFGPFQAYIYTGDYPLRREVYLINREGRPGLGTGFASFVAGEQGQRVIRLSGLLPSSPYTRNIKLN